MMASPDFTSEGRLRFSLLLSLALALAMVFLHAPVASAECAPDSVPPDNSEVDQYLEAVPGSCGERSPNGKDGGPTAEPEDVIGEEATDELRSLGDDGAAAASLAAETASPASIANDSNGADDGAGSAIGGDDGGGPGESIAAATDGSAIAGLSGAVTGGGTEGSGVLLPALMIGILLLVGAALLARRRRGADL